ncbi:GDSL-type esterase/lipase family protein [Rheinheimera maricola]|uniref:GDSL-type esterase/lipase family protein n=1 Tax=Rheinheimera maricola TaxID=2793282 RepID=A0ABS7XFS8_9GAMM|nr:GDSL-type esterase/lipase family protein [Rheinheimera maricola]MBZ9613382.1 GDSL-type esterase/lipase family protein [Rheinheimera maricola]
MKQRLFWLIGLLLPLLLLAMLELTLRLAGIGKQLALFIDNPANTHYLLTRPDIIKRYFANGAAAPTVTMEPSFFLQQRPADGIRLVVQGGSTAAGYPYGVGASLAGMLEQRLRRSAGNRSVEVVNTALSAVNSYTLLDLADEIIAIKPDAVLIYAGHNEYLGIMGAGSTYLAAESPAATRWLLKLRRLSTFQLLEGAYQHCCLPGAVETAASDRRTLMARVAQGQHITTDSALYQAGIQQFSQNLALLLAKYQTAGIAVYLATTGSNIADQAPFAGAPLTEQQLSKLAQFQAQIDTGVALKDLDNATERLLGDAPSAHLLYQLGQLYRRGGEAERASQLLLAAKDADSLRFRAPEAINQQIRILAKQYNAKLVDVEAAWRQQSPLGLIGNNLMLEHLHPNVQGYFLLADSFYQALAQQPPLSDWPGKVAAELAWAERPLLPAEEHAAQLRVVTLMADYPFRDTPIAVSFPAAQNMPQQLAQAYIDGKLDWLGMMQQSARYYQQQRDGDMLLKALLIIADALPHDASANRQAAQILQQAGRAQEAGHYQRRAELAH